MSTTPIIYQLYHSTVLLLFFFCWRKSCVAEEFVMVWITYLADIYTSKWMSRQTCFINVSFHRNGPNHENLSLHNKVPMTYISRGQVQMTYISRGQVQMTYISRGQVQMMYISRGEVQMTYIPRSLNLLILTC